MTQPKDWRDRLMPGWAELVEASVEPLPESRRMQSARATLAVAARRPRLVADAVAAQDMLTLLFASPLAALAVDSEFRFGGRAVTLKSGREWNDIRSVEPLLVSVSAWLTSGGGDALATFVLDVRVPVVAGALGELLRLPVPLVAHHLKAELFTFWRLGLDPALELVYDTYIAAAALNLGVFHQRSGDGARTLEAVAAERVAAAQREGLLSLLGQGRLYGVEHPFAGRKAQLQRSFLNHPPGAPFTEDQVAYAAADADVTLRVYAAQQADLLRHGLRDHLTVVEFPFTVANARIEWAGVAVDWAAARRFRAACARAANQRAQELARHGVGNPNSPSQVLAALRGAGLGPHLDRIAGKGPSRTDKETLKALKGTHPLPGLLLSYRELARFATDEWLAGQLRGADGRLHPTHSQLRAETGRNACSNPSLVNLPGWVRPLIVAPPGRALLEFDYGQIEVAVAAAEHGDWAMIEAYNSADVYAAMAQRFYAEQLTEEERALPADAFKRARPDLRKTVKIFVLAVLFNMTAPTIAAKFGLTLAEAEAQRRRFLDTFPSVRDGMAAAAEYGLARGYAYVRTGLRRQASQFAARYRARNGMLNTPIQGGAAAVFKLAAVALDRHFRGTPTRVVLPIHDAFLVECDEADAERVTIEVKFLMAAAVRSRYPAILPKVDVNAVAPHCWNKDGEAGSLEAYMSEAGSHFASGGLRAPE